MNRHLISLGIRPILDVRVGELQDHSVFRIRPHEEFSFTVLTDPLRR